MFLFMWKKLCFHDTHNLGPPLAHSSPRSPSVELWIWRQDFDMHNPAFLSQKWARPLETVACWAPPETLPKAGPSVTWGRKVKSVPCRDAAASWSSSMKLWTPPWPLPVSQRWYFLSSIDFLVLFLSLFRTLASHRGAMYYITAISCWELEKTLRKV